MEGLAGHERKGHENATTRGLLLSLSGVLPIARESRHAIVGAIIAQHHQVGVQLLDRPLLFARLPCLLSQHMRQLVGVWVQPARPIRDANFGSTLSERRYLRTVFRDRLVRRDISRIEKWSR